MKWFWGGVLGAVLASLVFMWVTWRAAEKREAEFSRVVNALTAKLEKRENELADFAGRFNRLQRNLCGDKKLTVEELSYRCD